MKLAPEKDCTACMACVDACAHGVLGCRTDNDGYFNIYVDNPQKCTNCGLCSKVCPVISPLPKASGTSRLYAAWDTDNTRRKSSASGGAFTAIAARFIETGGVVYGACITGFEVSHIRVTNIDDLHLLQGAKYQPSVLTGTYREIRRDLTKGVAVLFSGLSCQTAALKKFLIKDYPNLYTIDLVCGGISSLLPMQNLAASGRYSGIVSFRDKSDGWKSQGFRYCLKMLKHDGCIENLGNNNVLKSFSSALFKRSSCLSCKFCGPNRHSDATIGDFWGISGYENREIADGISAVVMHNHRLSAFTDYLHLEDGDWSTFLNHNPRYITPYGGLIRFSACRSLGLKQLRNDRWADTAPGWVKIYLKARALKNKFHRSIYISRIK